ncbi:MAG: SPOR domain-containing protein [Gluconacetobacter diazotrophicus]|nr:SPOR domain-containing protein [Gluconacetobacter diazotrophicus]
MAYAPAPSAIAPASAGCPGDPDAAFDAPCPSRPVAASAAWPAAYAPRPSPPAVAAAGPLSSTRPAVLRAAASARIPATGNWAIQVGAFNSVDQARFATTMARQADYPVLGGSQSVVQPTAPFGHAVLYRARLAGLARGDAGDACQVLRAHDIPCMVVAPGG